MKERKTGGGGGADRGARILKTGARGGESQVELHFRDRQTDRKFHPINSVVQSKYRSKWDKDRVLCVCVYSQTKNFPLKKLLIFFFFILDKKKKSHSTSS